MKVGIITIIDNNNYGNRLQCYAVQKILRDLNIEPETIYYGINLNMKPKNKLDAMKKIIKSYYIEFRRYIKKLLKNRKRRKNFKEFNRNIKTVNNRSLVINKNSHKKYDYFFVGSDQIWNPNFGRFGDVEFLTFVPEEKRIAFVPSFGVTAIKKEYEDFCKEPLKNFKAISAREDSGKEIIEKLTQRKDVEVLVDPTMMLTEEDWQKVEKKPKCLKSNKFIICYFLGAVLESNMTYIKKQAQKNNLNIIELNNKDNDFYNIGPSEFIYLLRNAKYIYTDSFHACVFSIIFKKEFIVFDRESKGESMQSRIETLLEKFHLTDRKYNEKEIKPVDYSISDSILNNEREKTIKFLKNALNI